MHGDMKEKWHGYGREVINMMKMELRWMEMKAKAQRQRYISYRLLFHMPRCVEK